MGSSLAGAAVLPLASLHAGSARTVAITNARSAYRQTPEASAANWRTWYLTSPDQLRPEAPGAPSQAEIDEVLELQAARTDESTAAIARWHTGPPLEVWTNLGVELMLEFGFRGMAQGRWMAIYQTALHDAVIAAWDAQLAHERPSPGATSTDITPLPGFDPSLSSFPSVQAAMAGAAAVVLPYLLPDAEAGRFDALAEEVVEAQIAAGAAFRSDTVAGLDLGRAVGDLAVARGKSDGSDAVWDPATATRPTGPGYWEPTPPGFVETPTAPLAGSWKTWVLESGDQVRPGPPPEYNSTAWKAELKMVQEIVANRSFEQERAAIWWGASSPTENSLRWANELINKAGVDLPHAAQIIADTCVSMADASIAVWDAKYTWWTSRPITEDPTLVTVLPSPPYPSYPSGYSGLIGAATTVVGHYFPDAADDLADRAWEAAASRGWAGLHYVIDDDVALTMGRQVGRIVCALPGANVVEDA
jgi:membrane-associated phospholipid phosphatase